MIALDPGTPRCFCTFYRRLMSEVNHGHYPAHSLDHPSGQCTPNVAVRLWQAVSSDQPLALRASSSVPFEKALYSELPKQALAEISLMPSQGES